MNKPSKTPRKSGGDNDNKQQELRERIEAGEKRNAERNFGDYAREAADNAAGFARKHPIATVAGAVTVGLLIGAMTRPGRRAARRTGVLAGIAAEAAMAYGLKFRDEAGDLARGAGSRLADVGDRLGTRSRDLGRSAAHGADVGGDALRSAARKGGRALRELRGRITH